MRKIKNTDGFVKNHSLDKNSNEIIIYKITGKTQINQALTDFHTIREDFCIAHLHSEERSLVLHSNVLCTICQGKVAKIWKVLEYNGHVKMRKKLSNFETENLISGSLQFLFKLWDTGLVLMAFEQSLNSSLDECLFETVSVVFFLAVFERFTFFVPIEFKIDVSCSCSDGKVEINKFDDRL